MHAPIPGSLSSQQVWFFRHTGYLRVGNGVPEERLYWLRDLIDELFQEGRGPCERSSSGRVVRVSDLASVTGPALFEEFSSPEIVDPLESLLGPNIDFIRNRHNHATVALEPTYRSRLHRDVLQWSRSIVSVVVYLDDCTEARSATRVIPGSQLLSLVGTPNNGGTWMDEHEVYSDLMDQSLPVPASAGDILLLDGLVFHAGGLALDDHPRRVITLAYTSVDELLEDEDLRSRVLARGRRLHRGGSYS
ncbi:MAG: hypothetical protein QOH66_1322 [Actinomycetota bacterium]|nr:hypothetical protein [Actinomycetota bacterium]